MLTRKSNASTGVLTRKTNASTGVLTRKANASTWVLTHKSNASTGLLTRKSYASTWVLTRKRNASTRVLTHKNFFMRQHPKNPISIILPNNAFFTPLAFVFISIWYKGTIKYYVISLLHYD